MQMTDSHNNSLNYPRQYLKLNEWLVRARKLLKQKQNKVKNPSWPETNIKHVGY